MQWYYAKEGNQFGPVDDTEFRRLAHEGKILPDDLVWNESLGEEWKTASSFGFLFFRPVDLQPPELPKEPDLLAEAGKAGTLTNRELMKQARESLQGHWAEGVLATVLYLFVVFLLSFLGRIFSAHSAPHQASVFAANLAFHQSPNLFGNLLQIIISPPLGVGFCFFFLGIARRSKVQITQIFLGFGIFWKSLGTYWLIALLSFFWFLLFLFPLVLAFLLAPIHQWQQQAQHHELEIVIAVLGLLGFAGAMVKIFSYSLAFLVLADEPSTGSVQAIRRSKALMQGKKWKLLCLYFHFLGWWLLALLTCGIGYLWVIPYMQASLCHFYLDAKKNTPEELANPIPAS